MQGESTTHVPSGASENLIDIIADMERAYWCMMATGAWGSNLDPDGLLSFENRRQELRFINYPCRNADDAVLKINYILERGHLCEGLVDDFVPLLRSLKGLEGGAE